MIEKEVNLRLDECAFPERIRVSQFDTMWKFVFGILYKSRPWQIPTGATAVLNGRKPDGNVFAFAGTIADNKVTVDADVQMTAVAGQTVCELSILADGKTVGTANFILDVEAAPKSPDDVSSDSTLPAYGELLGIVSGDIESAVNKWLNAHSSQIGGLSSEAKNALLALLDHVGYDHDVDGQRYLGALREALFPPASLVSISVVFNQGQNAIYDTDSLDTLKQYLTVTANMSDGTTQTVTNYTLSGTMTVGTSAITVSYGGKTTTFNVTVTEYQVPDTSAVIKSTDNGYNTSGVEVALAGASTTEPMSLGQTYEQGAGNVTIKYYFPKDANVSFTASKTKARFSLSGGAMTDYTSITYADASSSTATESTMNYGKSYGSVNEVAFTLATSHVDDSYAYLNDTGHIIFAGKNTKYYGMSNISEVTA